MARGYASSLLIVHSTNDSYLLAFEKQLVAGKQTWKNPSHCHQLITWKGIDERFKKEAEKGHIKKETNLEALHLGTLHILWYLLYRYQKTRVEEIQKYRS